jgi:hypothetical protein
VVCGLLLAWKTARRLECWGWLLIAVSMCIGLLTGLYAFDGPLPAPPTQTEYNEFTRRLTRLGHAYAIVLGMLAILTARTAAGRWPATLLVTGTCMTLAAIAVQPFWPFLWLLTLGPILVVLALGLTIVRKTPLVPGPA